ncbi:hypothetical protein ACLOJK_017435 [Asimina triloba]
MSIYREEAIEALIEALHRKDFPMTQVVALYALESLSGRLAPSGRSLIEASLLKTAGLNQLYNTLIKTEKMQKVEDESVETMRKRGDAVIDASGFEFQCYKSGVFQGPCGTDLDHGVAAIGFGTAADGGKYWLVKNSWGTSGGEEGYIRMQRDVSPKSGLVEWSGVPAMVEAFSLLAVGISMIGTMLGFFQFFEEQLTNLTFPSLPTKSLQEKWAAREGGGGLGPALRWRCHRVHCTATYG